MKYPFIPKSTAYLEGGHIISIPLSNSTYSCARVLQCEKADGTRDSRYFVIGLMDWNEPCQPSSDYIAGLEIIDHGQVHIKTIRECSSAIVGHRDLKIDNIDTPLSLDESPGSNCHLRKGLDILRVATPEEQRTLKIFSTWGYNVLKIKAEKHFVR